MRQRRRLARLLVGLLALATGAACDQGETLERLEGRDFDEVRLVALHRGQSTRAEVREVLGEPFRRSGPPEAEEWEYYVRYRRTPARVLGLFPAGKPSEFSRRLLVGFRGDFVDRVQQDANRD